MKTPKQFTENLKKGIITTEMLEQVLFSINKRAKNWRDKKREYKAFYREHRYYTDDYDNIKKCEEKEKEYYAQKEFLLKTLLTPVCIHKEIQVQTRKKRIYDYEKDYKKHTNKGYWENCYYDEFGDEIWFVDVPYEEKIDRYYLYYEVGTHSFHTPIESPKGYNYEIIKIDELTTYGEDITELVSVQFCNKLIDLVKSGNYVLKL